MAQYHVSATALIPTPAKRVYAIIADYHTQHPRILPKPPFGSLTVEQGGLGAGTIITFTMRLMGRLQTFRAMVTEPEPGRVLRETDLDTGAITTFTVEPRDNGAHSQVTIVTETRVRDGFSGKVEGWFTTQLLRPIYIKELEQLAAVAAK